MLRKFKSENSTVYWILWKVHQLRWILAKIYYNVHMECLYCTTQYNILCGA